ncbi:MAG: hypothetical protein K2L55_09205 [Muribaculaceae bacterium]|nr:hypothetical protein [Muribaculaceae bacterium]MDE6346834.1 hypothetical protein [Muribaculaceae bacterium]
MKKLFSTLFALAVIVSMTVLTSCGSGPSNESVGKIIEKYNNGDKLAEADYSTLLDYADAAFDEVLPIVKEAQEAVNSGDSDKIKKLQEKSEKIVGKYKYMEEAMNIVENADVEDLGAANGEKLMKVVKKITDSTGMSMEDFL